MPTIEDKLKGYIVENFGSVKNFAELTAVPYQTIVSILLRGIQSGKFGNIENMCHVLGISMDELSKGRIDSRPIINLQNVSRMNRDLPTLIRQYTRFVKHEGKITLDDEPLTDEEYTLLWDSLNVVTEILRYRRRKNVLKGEDES